MSLRIFHAVFIGVCVLLTVFFALWGFNAYQADGTLWTAVAGCISLAAGAGLVGYERSFIRKTREQGIV